MAAHTTHIFAATVTLAMTGAHAGALVAAPDPEFRSYLAHIAAADASLRLNEPGAARRWLSGAPEAHRGWEWRLLDAQADQSIATLGTHEQTIFDIAFSPDGTRCVSSSGDGTAVVRDAATGAPIATLRGHEGTVYRAAFSPDGARVATAGADKTTRVWNAATGEPVCIYKGLPTPNTGAVFSPDGATVYCCNYTPLKERPFVDGTIKAFDARTGDEKGEWKGLGVKPISMLALSRDGSLAAVSTWDGEVWLADLAAGASAPPRALKVPEEGRYTALNAVALSPDASRVAAASKDRTVRVWDVATGELTHTLRHDAGSTVGGEGGWATGVTFSPDGGTIASVGLDGLVRLWDAATGELERSLRGHTAGVWCAAFSPDGERLLTAGNDNAVRVWDTSAAGDDALSLTRRAGSRGGCYAASLSADGATIATAYHDGAIRLYDARTGDERRVIEAFDDKPCNTASLSADGSRVAGCEWGGEVKVFDAATGEEVTSIKEEGRSSYVCLSPDGSLVAMVHGKTARVRRVPTGQPVREFPEFAAPVSEVGFDGSGTIAVAGGGREVRVITVEERVGGDAAYFIESGRVQTCALSKDAGLIAAGDDGGRVHLWRNEGGAVQRPASWTAQVSEAPVYRVRFTPDGSRLIAAGQRVWVIDVASGEVMLALPSQGDQAWHLSLSADGTRVATAWLDGTWSVLDTIPWRERRGPLDKAAAENSR